MIFLAGAFQDDLSGDYNKKCGGQYPFRSLSFIPGISPPLKKNGSSNSFIRSCASSMYFVNIAGIPIVRNEGKLIVPYTPL